MNRLILLLMITLPFFACSKSSPKNEKIRVLVITGGHDFEREPFFEMFDSFEDVSYREVVHPQANDYYAADSAKRFDVFVFYDMNQEITPAQKESMIRMFEQGKGAVFLHHSLASYQDWDEFYKILGGRYWLKPHREGGREIPGSTYKHDVDVEVKIVDPDHPVTRGMSDFVIHDEVYGGFQVAPFVEPLLTTSHPESGEVIAWAHTYGASRIVYIQSGHDHKAYENENYRRLVRQAIEWTAHFEKPQ